MLPELKQKIKKILNRGWLIDEKHRHYERDNGGIVKRFPHVSDQDLEKVVINGLDKTRPEKRRMCKFLFGQLKTNTWLQWTAMEKELKNGN